MAAIILDLVVPGAGSAFSVLQAIVQLCDEMKEGQAACRRMYHRLQDILTELNKLQRAHQLPPSESLAKYGETLNNYLAYLQKYRGRPLCSRLFQGKKMMDELKHLNEDVDTLLTVLHLSTSGMLVDWKAQWQVDREAHGHALAAVASSNHGVTSEVKGMKEQLEAMHVLLYELRSGRHDPETLKPAKKMLDTIVSVSSAAVPTLYPWFLPRDDVEYDPQPFARGAFGAVHRGTWGSGARVVVKTLELDDAAAPTAAKKQFLDEINIWFTLNHPHVIKMYGASHVTTPPFIVCEDATKGNLSEFLCDTATVRSHMWRLLYEAALGLECLHKHRVVHGDLKLNNILIGSDGAARIADFGLSFVSAASKLGPGGSAGGAGTIPGGSTFEGSGVGGMRWRAPECLSRRPTFAADIYSLGMCILEAVGGEPPYTSYASEDIVYHLKNDGQIPDRPPGITDAAWSLVVAMTARDPTVRCPLGDVIGTLRRFVDAKDPSAPVEAVDDLPGDRSSVDRHADEPVEVQVDRTETLQSTSPEHTAPHEATKIEMHLSDETGPAHPDEVSLDAVALDVATSVENAKQPTAAPDPSSRAREALAEEPVSPSKPPASTTKASPLDSKVRPMSVAGVATKSSLPKEASRKETQPTSAGATAGAVARMKRNWRKLAGVVLVLVAAAAAVTASLVLTQSSSTVASTGSGVPTPTPTSAPTPTTTPMLTYPRSPPTAAPVREPTPYGFLTVSSDTNVYVANDRALYCQPASLTSGSLELYAGSAAEVGDANGLVTDARFTDIVGLVEAGTTLYVVEREAYAIRAIDRSAVSETVSVVAGSAGGTSGDTDGALADATFGTITAVAFDSGSNGDLYVADYSADKIRKVSFSQSSVSTFLTLDDLSISDPSALAVQSATNAFYFATQCAIFRLASDGSTKTLVAGAVGDCTYTGTPQGTDARFSTISALALSALGDTLYIADKSNHCIRKMDVATAEVMTVAGVCGSSGSSVGSPRGLVFDNGDLVFIADNSGLGEIRRLQV